MTQGWLLALLLSGGCVVHKQVQYFAVTAPETDLTNDYKMTVCGSGGLGTDYHLQAGYFSAPAMDILRGSMPKVPALDMDIEHEARLRKLTDQFYGSLIQDAKAQAPIMEVCVGVSGDSAIMLVMEHPGQVRVYQVSSNPAQITRNIGLLVSKASGAAAKYMTGGLAP